MSAPEPAALFLRHQLEINRVHLLVQYGGIPVAGLVVCPLAEFSKANFTNAAADSRRLLRNRFRPGTSADVC